jgi:hypothetical protein
MSMALLAKRSAFALDKAIKMPHFVYKMNWTVPIPGPIRHSGIILPRAVYEANSSESG